MWLTISEDLVQYYTAEQIQKLSLFTPLHVCHTTALAQIRIDRKAKAEGDILILVN
jgi:hypothetical protein